MKKPLLLNCMLFAFLAFQFSSCDNEPLEGEFVQQEEVIANAGQFIATVGGIDFEASFTDAIFTSNNSFFIIGIDETTGANIVLLAENAGEGVFNITSDIGTFNQGSYNSTNAGIPYTSTALLGGSGQLVISNINTESVTVTGIFSFIGARVQLGDDGKPLLDTDGNPLTEIIDVTAGSFNAIPYTISTEEEENEESLDGSFFANVDDLAFVAANLTTTRTIVGSIDMVNIVATNELGDVIRIDIPEALGEGTFDMENLSDGTDLIAVYNPANIGENLSSNPGTIIITDFNSFTGIIAGTFQFTGTDPLGIDPTVVQVTDGSFSVTYIPSDVNSDSNMFAEIDEMPFQSINLLSSQTVFNGTSRLNVLGTDETTMQSIGLFFPSDIEAGTYDLSASLIDGDEIIATFTPEVGVSITYNASPGTLTITSNNTDSGLIEGAFQFTAIDIFGQDETEFVVANGEFSLQI